MIAHLRGSKTKTLHETSGSTLTLSVSININRLKEESRIAWIWGWHIVIQSTELSILKINTMYSKGERRLGQNLSLSLTRLSR